MQKGTLHSNVLSHTTYNSHDVEATQVSINRQMENEILPFVTTWMKLEGIMLSEICETEKDKYRVI